MIWVALFLVVHREAPHFDAEFPAGGWLVVLHTFLVPPALLAFMTWPWLRPDSEQLLIDRLTRTCERLFWIGSAGCALLLAMDPFGSISWFMD